jgi:hypothetical protein
MFARIAVATTLLLALPHASSAQDKLEGQVLSTTLTHCDFKPGGCAGHLVLETTQAGKAAQVTVQVPLGTMIRRGSETAYLPSLNGSRVVIALDPTKAEQTATSIEAQAGR